MNQAVLHRMSADAFLEWQEWQDELYELIDGVPAGMVGARQNHDMIVMNAAREIGTQLRGTRCRPFSESLAVRIPAGNVRRPDLGVDCSPLDARSTSAGEIRMVIEVLSPSTRALDLFGKLDEYKTIASLDYILLVDPDRPEVILWSRDADRAWRHAVAAGLDASIEMPALKIVLKLADLYEGLTFRPPPRLVGGPA